MLRALQRTTLVPPTTCRRRSFFDFATKNHSRESETQRYHEQKILPFQRSELYKVIADIEAYSNFVPYCTDARVFERKASQDGATVMEAELTVGFLAFRESYVSVVTCKPYESVEAVVSSSTPLFKTLTTAWRLQPVSHSSSRATSLPREVSEESLVSRSFPDERPTLVTLDLAFAFADPMHTAVSATFFGQVSKLMVKAFEQRCNALYGPGTC